MAKMTGPNDYILGSSEREHERLIRQARMLAPCTRRLFEDAGVGPGMKVLDIGSGVGDVALLTAALVTKSGSVLGIDREASALNRARLRAKAGAVEHLQFVQQELTALDVPGEFDAIVGRFVLMFLPDPGALLRAVASRLRPGGVMVFQEASWSSFFAMTAHLPLYSTCGHIMSDVLQKAGGHSDMGLALYRGLIDAGLSLPQMRVEVLLASECEDRRWLHDLLQTVWDSLPKYGLSAVEIGDRHSLGERLDAELQSSLSFAPSVGLVGAWARKPNSDSTHDLAAKQ